MKRICFLLTFLLLVDTLYAQSKKVVDICIYGASSAGIVAAYTASKAGKTVLLVDPGYRVGGLSSGGLGQTDIGNKFVVQGLGLDFYRKIGSHYNTLEQWIFEPKVADSVFRAYMNNSSAEQLMGSRLREVVKDGVIIKQAVFVNDDQGQKVETLVEAKVFMDCTYEGDLLAAAGASYHVGRESNATYGETLNGVQLLDGHQFPDGIDPYVERGNPASGLLWGVNNEQVKPQGTGDHKVQAYNYRITLTNVPSNMIPITKPENYDPKIYELLRRQKEIQPWKGINDVFIWSLMPNGKTDINNRNGFSTDMIGMNWEYPEGDEAKRKEIVKAHEDYTKGLLYFVGNDASVPKFVRDEMNKWGYPKDEYIENDHWSPSLYIREARRMVSDLVMTQHHCQGREIVDDAVGYAAYTMDSHNCDRLVVNGMVKNEGNVEVGGFLPFPISYRSIVPKRQEVGNLIVPVCLSASHIAFGSIRMEPVFMVLAQSGAVAACQAIDSDIVVQDVDVRAVQNVLEENPKADFRRPDLLVHVSEHNYVDLDGSWEKRNGGGYGLSHMFTDGKKELSKARFNMTKTPATGKYKLFTYYIKTADSASKYTVRIFNGRTIESKTVDLSDVQIIGQTNSTWVSIGEIDMQQGSSSPYIEISNEEANGVVVANAVLLVPQTD